MGAGVALAGRTVRGLAWPVEAVATIAAVDLVPGIRTGLRNRLGVLGSHLSARSPDDLSDLACRTAVFARVTPDDKVTIVRALRAGGKTVAVTGDGANDAPAIRLADVGIALGENSTAAARQAADIVVTDDRIESIVDAVIESRAMWRSVRDSVALLVGGNLGEIAFVVISSLLPGRAALNARQLLLVNLLTDLVPALTVAVRPPRNVTSDQLLREGPDAAIGSALEREVAVRAVATATSAIAGWSAARVTGTAGRAGTVALGSLIGAQLAQTAASAHGDPVVLAAALASGLALGLLVQFPPTSFFFGCRPLGPVAWAIVVSASLLALVTSHLARSAIGSSPAGN